MNKLIIKLPYIILILISLFILFYWYNKNYVNERKNFIFSFDQHSVYVYETKEKRCLTFTSPNNSSKRFDTQSCFLLSSPNELVFPCIKAMLSALYLNPNPKKILMIGLGGGSLAKALLSILPNTHLDIVEINPILPEVAQEYFSFYPSKNTRIFIDDGLEFINKLSSSQKYDFIILDAFTGIYVPPEFLTLKFVKKVKEILEINGVVAINTFLYNTYYELENKLYKEAFGSFFNLIAGGNRVIIAKNGLLPNYDDLEEQTLKFKDAFLSFGIKEDIFLPQFKKSLL